MFKPSEKLGRIAIQSALSTLLVMSGLGATAMLAPSATPVAVAAPRAACPDAQERAFLRRLNGYRKQRGLEPLVIDTALMQAAHNHSVDMTKMADVRNHTLRNGDSSKQNMARFGYPVGQAKTGENLAFGTDWNTGSEVLGVWKGSKSHNSKLVRGEFRAIGIARVHAPNSKYGWYWTATFGTIVSAQPTC